ncbi:B12-binding domain-containing radical SAM protein [Paenibacillus sp. NPDC057934]|uniref:B12-binding domain-containing radical SAM protein n=1 Tax=Paenibacillus sp. NPDC057934 TaxID=3346282 RepID=UPI0036D7C6DC
MDAILISPMEVSLRQTPRTFRENNVKNDVDALTSGPLNQVFVRRYRENLGVACLGGYLREREMDVRILNANIMRLTLNDVVNDIMQHNPTLVGISALYDLHAFQTAQIIRELRRRGYSGHITLGGPFASFTHQYFLAAFFGQLDSVIRGEGEIPLYQLLLALKSGEPWKHIQGLSSVEENRNFLDNGNGEVEELENLPLPSRDALDALREVGIQPRVASLNSSRGCYGQCTYCHAPATAKMVDAKKWRLRPAEKILDEIDYLVRTYGVEYIYFNDDNFMGYGPAAKQRLIELAKGIIARDIKISFHGECRVDTKSFLDQEFLELMRQAGLKDVLLGLESGSQTTLNRWRKGTTVSGNLSATQRLSEMGFDVEPAMILVDAYTTVEEFSETVKFIKEAKLHTMGSPLYLFNRLVVFPGAPIEMELAMKNIIEVLDPWDIRHDLNSDEGLYEHIRRISSRPYKIQSKEVAVMWDIVVIYSDYLTFLVDDVMPDILRQWRTYIMDTNLLKEERNNSKSDYLDFVKQLRVWRRDLGELVISVLDSCVELIKQLDPESPDSIKAYHDRFSLLIRKYEETCFSTSLNDRLKGSSFLKDPLPNALLAFNNDRIGEDYVLS